MWLNLDRLTGLIILAIMVAVAAGCSTGANPPPPVNYPHAYEKISGQDDSGERYAVHEWKKSDSLSFLAMYYADDPAAAAEIEKANPNLSFTGRLPEGTQVWIPEYVILPSLRQRVHLIGKSEFSPTYPAGAPIPDPPKIESGLVYKVSAGETINQLARFYTGKESNAAGIVAANPGLDPVLPLKPGQEVFIPANLIDPRIRSRVNITTREVRRPDESGRTEPASILKPAGGLSEETLAPTTGVPPDSTTTGPTTTGPTSAAPAAVQPSPPPVEATAGQADSAAAATERPNSASPTPDSPTTEQPTETKPETAEPEPADDRSLTKGWMVEQRTLIRVEGAHVGQPSAGDEATTDTAPAKVGSKPAGKPGASEKPASKRPL